jgi:hypothetical protein
LEKLSFGIESKDKWENKMKPVTNRKTLRRLVSEGLIKEPKYDKFPRVDEQNLYNLDSHGYKYRAVYTDGNFYPFLYRIEKYYV